MTERPAGQDPTSSDDGEDDPRGFAGSAGGAGGAGGAGAEGNGHSHGHEPSLDDDGEVADVIDDEDEEEDDDEEGLESVTVEITGLSLYTHHGASEAEREVGQRLVLDLRLDLGEADATATDRVEDTVDYAQVCQLVALIAQQRSHRTLERLCATIAERLLSEYELEGVWVKATKPEPPIPLPVEGVSVEVWREPD
jgi:dihydroneopterin aldolase